MKKSIGDILNNAGLFKVKVWRLRHRLFWRRYEFTCDVCELRSATCRTSNEAWRGAQRHADLHGALIRQQLQASRPIAR